MIPLNVALICVFLQVSLTFIAIYRMGTARIRSVREKEVSIKDIAVETSAYPISVKNLQNNVRNQFETPLLFYVAICLAAALDCTNWGMALSAVGYVATRYVHHYVHTGSNYLTYRFNAFLLGFVFLVICWLSLGMALVNLG